MPEEKRSARESRIEEAAYALLVEKGYSGCSMLSVAKKASASNETMYKWFGDKVGLMSWLIARNAADVIHRLESHNKSREVSGITALRQISPVLLALLVSERAVIINRAATGDQTGQLGKTLANSGRETVVPLLSQIFKKAKAQNEITFSNLNEAVELYLGLLIGDMQIRRVVHNLAEPTPAWIKKRSALAVDRLQSLLAP